MGTTKKVSGREQWVSGFVFNVQRSNFAGASQAEISRLQGKCAQLEAALSAREQELVLADAKYRKYAEKAKEVIKNLDPRMLSGKFRMEAKLIPLLMRTAASKSTFSFRFCANFGKKCRQRSRFDGNIFSNTSAPDEPIRRTFDGHRLPQVSALIPNDASAIWF